MIEIKKRFSVEGEENTIYLSQAETAREAVIEAISLGVDLSGSDLSGMDLSGLDFSNMDLSGVSFIDSKIDSVNFFGANLDGATVSTISLPEVNSGVQGVCDVPDLNILDVTAEVSTDTTEGEVPNGEKQSYNSI